MLIQYTGPGDEQVIWLAADSMAEADAFVADYGWPQNGMDMKMEAIADDNGLVSGVDVDIRKVDGHPQANVLVKRSLYYRDRAD